MTMALHSITVDCHDCYAQSLFWTEVTGWQEDPQDPNGPGDPNGRLVGPHWINLLFIPVPEGKFGEPRTGHHRMHLDLMPTVGTRNEEVERLLGLGATLVGDHRKPDGTGWVVLADPEGNEFCVERSPAERTSAI
ncbi:VOC family protein [Catellatospora coxensis]|nr:VOC family protein [Catellatospora coxensis]